MIRDTFINDDYHRQAFHEGALFGASETLNTLMDHWDGIKDRKGARADVAKIRSRYSLECERDLPSAGQDILRPYAALDRACDIAFANPIDKGDKSWSVLNIIGQSTFVAMAVVALALVMGA